MFNDIFHTAIRFSVILLVFIVAFGLGFHLIFINQVSIDIPFTYWNSYRSEQQSIKLFCLKYCVVPFLKLRFKQNTNSLKK